MTKEKAVQNTEVEATAIGHNLGFFKEHLTPRTDLLAVAKANAYGHRLAEVATIGSADDCPRSLGNSCRVSV
jgi:alanine racemase